PQPRPRAHQSDGLHPADDPALGGGDGGDERAPLPVYARAPAALRSRPRAEPRRAGARLYGRDAADTARDPGRRDRSAAAVAAGGAGRGRGAGVRAGAGAAAGGGDALVSDAPAPEPGARVPYAFARRHGLAAT